MRGACLDANFAPARPSPARLRRLGMTGARLVATPTLEFLTYHVRLRRAGLETAVLLTLDSFPEGTDSPSLKRQAQRYAETLRPLPTLWLATNEANVSGDASWPQGRLASVWNAIYEGLAGSGVPIWLGGLFSEPGIVEHLKRILEELDYAPDGVDIHAYMESAEEAEAIFTEINSWGLPTACLEWNDSTPGGVASYERVLERCTSHSCFLPWTRAQTATEAQPLPGLVSGTHTTSLGRAYARALKGAA